MLGLDQLVGILASLESKAIRVHPRQCAPLRHRRSQCRLCAEHCPAQAISWQGSTLTVDPQQCLGCGVCAAVCPTGALEAQSPTDGELVARLQEVLKEREWLAFACPRYLGPRAAEGKAYLRVSCLGRLDESVLVAAVALGAREVWLVDGACEGCPQAAGRDVAVQAVRRANALLGACGRGEALALGPQLPAALQAALPTVDAAEAVSRRAFFSVLKRETARKAAMAVGTLLGEPGPQEEAPVKGEMPTRLPARRRLLLAALKRLGPPAVGRSAPADLWAQVLLKDNCTACRMCAFFCPTGALAKAGEGLAFRVAACTNCGLCQQVCYQKALALSPAVDLTRVLSDEMEMLPLHPAVAAGRGPSLQETIARRILGTVDAKSE